MNKLLEFIGQSPATKSFGISLLHSIWQGAAIAVILWIGMRILKNFQAQIRYYSAFLSLLLLSAAFSSTFYLQYLEYATPHFQLEEINLSSLKGLGTGEFHEQKTRDINIFQQVEEIWFTSILWLKQHTAYIFLLWSVGFIFYSGRFFLGLNYLERLKRSSNPVPQNWQKTMVTLQQKLGLRKKVRLLFSHQLSTPLTFGWLKPVIIFPASVLAQLPMDQVESILLHELIHIRQRDYLISLLQSITEMLFFFNPGYWYISSILNKERENTCDDQVIATTENTITYARALSSLAELSLLQESQPALAVANHKQQLLSRIKRIISPQKPRTTMKPFLRNRGYQLVPIGIICLIIAFFSLDVKGNIQNQLQVGNGENTSTALTDTTKNGKPQKTEAEKKIFSTISKGYLQIAKTDSEGNPMVISMTSDSIILYDNFSAEGAGNGEGHVRFDKINMEKINQSLTYSGTLQTLTTNAKTGAPYLNTIAGDSVKVTFENSRISSFSGATMFGKNLSDGNSKIRAKDNQASIVTVENDLKGTDPVVLTIKGKEGTIDLSSDSGEGKLQETIKKALSEGEVASGIDDIPAESIASITVIKHEAEKLFGEKGKNGVIIVTLKNKKEDPKVDIKASDSNETLRDTVPLILVLEHSQGHLFSPENLPRDESTIKAMAEHALKWGTPIHNKNEIAQRSIEAIEVWNKKTEYFGEKGKDGVIIVVLREGFKAPAKSSKEDEREFIVYPNPSDDLVKIRFSLSSAENVKITAHDNSNNLLKTVVNQSLKKGTHEYVWNASQQAPGLYIITLVQGKKVMSKKVEIR